MLVSLVPDVALVVVVVHSRVHGVRAIAAEGKRFEEGGVVARGLRGLRVAGAEEVGLCGSVLELHLY